MNIRVALLGGDELVRRGLDGMLRTLGGFEMGSIKERMRAPIDIALVETYGTSLEDTTLSRAVADPYIDEIAREMQISLNSVKSYIRSAYRKTGVQSRSQAVLWAVSHGLGAEMLERAAVLARPVAVACSTPAETQVLRRAVSR